MTALEFNCYLDQVKPHLNRYAYMLTANCENARDLVQDTFFKALANQDKFRDDINFKAWTFTIMRNIFINNYRKGSKYRRIDHQPDHYSITQKYVSVDNPDGGITMQQIAEAIDLLEYDYKMPLLMHVQGFKYHEIAQKLNLKMGTVKSRIFLSRKKLGQSLRDPYLKHVYFND